MELVEKINELAFFSLLNEEKESVKMSRLYKVGDEVDHVDDVNSLLFVVVLSGASVASNCTPSEICCGACDSEEDK